MFGLHNKEESEFCKYIKYHDLHEIELYMKDKNFSLETKVRHFNYIFESKLLPQVLIDLFDLPPDTLNKCLNIELKRSIEDKTYINFINKLPIKLQVDYNITNQLYISLWPPKINLRQAHHINDSYEKRLELLRFLIENTNLDNKFLEKACKDKRFLWVTYLINYGNFDLSVIPDKYIDDCIKTYNCDYIESLLMCQNTYISLNAENHLLNIIKTSNVKCLELLLSDSRFQDNNILNKVFNKSIQLLEGKNISRFRTLYLCIELILRYLDYSNYFIKSYYVAHVNYYINDSTHCLFKEGMFYLCYLKLLFVENKLFIDGDEYNKAKLRIKDNIKLNNTLDNIIIIALRSGLSINQIKSNNIIDILWNNYGKYLYNIDILQHWPYDISHYIMKIMITNL